jgi:hypothetical protein
LRVSTRTRRLEPRVASSILFPGRPQYARIYVCCRSPSPSPSAMSCVLNRCQHDHDAHHPACSLDRVRRRRGFTQGPQSRCPEVYRCSPVRISPPSTRSHSPAPEPSAPGKATAARCQASRSPIRLFDARLPAAVKPSIQFREHTRLQTGWTGWSAPWLKSYEVELLDRAGQHLDVRDVPITGGRPCC